MGAQGLAALVSSCLCFSAMQACIIFIADEFPVPQIILVRCSIMAVISLGALLKAGESPLGPRDQRSLILGIAALRTTQNIVVWTAIVTIPQGNAMTLYATAPVFACFLSFSLIGERVSVVDGLCCATAVLGSWFVSRSMSEGLATPAQTAIAAMCLFSASLQAVSTLAIRRLGTEVHVCSHMLLFALGGVLLSVALMSTGATKAHWPPLQQTSQKYAVLLLVSALATAGQSLNTMGTQLVKGVAATIIRQISVPLSFAWQVAFFHRQASVASLVGACLVLGGTTAMYTERLLDDLWKADCPTSEAPLLLNVEEGAERAVKG